MLRSQVRASSGVPARRSRSSSSATAKPFSAKDRTGSRLFAPAASRSSRMETPNAPVSTASLSAEMPPPSSPRDSPTPYSRTCRGPTRRGIPPDSHRRLPTRSAPRAWRARRRACPAWQATPAAETAATPRTRAPRSSRRSTPPARAAPASSTGSGRASRSTGRVSTGAWSSRRRTKPCTSCVAKGDPHQMPRLQAGFELGR